MVEYNTGLLSSYLFTISLTTWANHSGAYGETYMFSIKTSRSTG